MLKIQKKQFLDAFGTLAQLSTSRLFPLVNFQRFYHTTPKHFTNSTDYINNKKFTHVDGRGKGKMVDVSHKNETHRIAIARGKVILAPDAYELVKQNKSEGGDVLTISRIAGITGAKYTSRLIPFCHNINLSEVNLTFDLDDDSHSISITARAKTKASTGVEMEALTAVNIGALALYDMCKSVSQKNIITDIKLLHKSGGRSGTYNHDEYNDIP